MVNDPIGDMLIQIKNAGAAGRLTVTLPASKVKLVLANLLVQEGYLASAREEGKAPKLSLKLDLKYKGKVSVITGLKRISKPGLRSYVGRKNIPKVVGGLGIAILSTPQGVMTGSVARAKGLGGELLCKVW